MSKQTDTATPYGEEDSTDHGPYRNKLASLLTTSTLGEPNTTRRGLPKRTPSEDSEGLYRDHALETTSTLGEPNSTNAGISTPEMREKISFGSMMREGNETDKKFCAMPTPPPPPTHLGVRVLTDSDPNETPKPENSTNKKSNFLTIALCILLLCALGGGVYFFMQFREGQSEIARLKSDHASEILSLKSNHETEVGSLKKAHATEVSRLESAHATDVSNLESDRATEVSRLGSAHATEVSRLELDHATLKKAHADLEDALKTATLLTSTNINFGFEVGRLKSEKGTLENNLESERETLAETLKASMGKDLQVSSLKQLVAELTSIQEKLKSQQEAKLESAREEAEDLRAKVKELDTEISSLKENSQTQHEISEKEKEKLQDDHLNNLSFINKQKEEEIQRKISELLQNRSISDGEKKKLMAEFKEAEENLVREKKELEQKTRDVEEKQAKLETFSQAIATFVKDPENVKKDYQKIYISFLKEVDDLFGTELRENKRTACSRSNNRAVKNQWFLTNAE